MKKADKIIEILARLCAIAVIIFCLWIRYELSIPEWDGMWIAFLGTGNNCMLDKRIQSGNLTVEIL